MVNRRSMQLLNRQRKYDREALNMATHGSYKVAPGPSLLELMSREIGHAKPGFYKNGLVAGREIVSIWREGQQKPYFTLQEHIIRCKRNNEDPEFIRGVATILAILIDPYNYMAKNKKFEITLDYIMSMED